MLVSLATAWAPLVMTAIFGGGGLCFWKSQEGNQNNCRRTCGSAQPESPTMFK